MKHKWIIGMVIVLLTGCAGTDSLRGSLQGRRGELVYLHDSAKTAEKQGATVKIGSFVVDDVLPPSTTVEEKSSFVLPLIFLNVWKYDYESSLGCAQIENDYKQFIRESFIDELNRTGKFSYAEGNGDIEIDLKIKAVKMAAPIHKNGHFIFAVYAFMWGQYTSAGPVDAVVTADAVVKKDGKELFSRELLGRGRAGVLKGKNLQLGDYTTAMIEAMSLAIKDLNEHIVEEINTI
jgi:hypothetical protein